MSEKFVLRGGLWVRKFDYSRGCLLVCYNFDESVRFNARELGLCRKRLARVLREYGLI